MIESTHPIPSVSVSVTAYGLTVDVTVSADPEPGGREGFDAVADLVAIAAAAAEHAIPTSPEFDAEVATALAKVVDDTAPSTTCRCHEGIPCPRPSRRHVCDDGLWCGCKP